MTTWILEPGHTAVEFRSMHMMVTWVRGMLKDVHGHLEFDFDTPLEARFEGEIDATKLWTGEPVRDEHLRSADFFDTDAHPLITFKGRFTERVGDTEFKAEAEVTIRGVTQTVPMDISYLGRWETAWWVGDENAGTIRRMGFTGRARVNRHDFGVSWQDALPGGGRVVSDEIELLLDAEAVHLGDLEETGAISYYRPE